MHMKENFKQLSFMIKKGLTIHYPKFISELEMHHLHLLSQNQKKKKIVLFDSHFVNNQ